MALCRHCSWNSAVDSRALCKTCLGCPEIVLQSRTREVSGDLGTFEEINTSSKRLQQAKQIERNLGFTVRTPESTNLDQALGGDAVPAKVGRAVNKSTTLLEKIERESSSNQGNGKRPESGKSLLTSAWKVSLSLTQPDAETRQSIELIWKTLKSTNLVSHSPSIPAECTAVQEGLISERRT